MNPPIYALRNTIASSALRARLSRMLGDGRDRAVAVGVWQHGHGAAFAAASGGPIARWPVPCGCLAKLFTAALIERAVDDGLELDCPLADYLPAARRSGSCADLTVRQLLEHRHGLDDSTLASVPRHRSARIDARALVTALDRRLFAPGTLYSYSNAGAWLCAAVLEARYDASYPSLLEYWAASRGIELGGPSGRAVRVCPAMGDGLVVPLPSLLRFARQQAERFGDGREPARLPGWNPLERGTHGAFKDYGGGWLGHQSTRPGASAWLRIHPRHRTAIVIEAGRQSAAVVGLRLFANRMPGFVVPSPPKAGGSAPPREAVYGTNAARVRLQVDGATATGLRWGRRWARLRPAPGGIYFTEPPLAAFPFVQLVSARDGSGPYLWNGRQISAPIAE